MPIEIMYRMKMHTTFLSQSLKEKHGTTTEALMNGNIKLITEKKSMNVLTLDSVQWRLL
jgi:hypothetical protein